MQPPCNEFSLLFKPCKGIPTLFSSGFKRKLSGHVVDLAILPVKSLICPTENLDLHRKYASLASIDGVSPALSDTT